MSSLAVAAVAKKASSQRVRRVWTTLGRGGWAIEGFCIIRIAAGH
jgi:hypothetical protein